MKQKHWRKIKRCSSIGYHFQICNFTRLLLQLHFHISHWHFVTLKVNFNWKMLHGSTTDKKTIKSYVLTNSLQNENYFFILKHSKKLTKIFQKETKKRRTKKLLCALSSGEKKALRKMKKIQIMIISRFFISYFMYTK